MTRRRILCGLLFALALLACLAGWLWIASGPRITRERFEQVKKGMSLEEVIRTVGEPPHMMRDKGPSDRTVALWSCDHDGCFLIVHLESDTVTGTLLDTFQPAPLTQRITERIRRWLGL
jgi:hypothetical protein